MDDCKGFEYVMCNQGRIMPWLCSCSENTPVDQQLDLSAYHLSLRRRYQPISQDKAEAYKEIVSLFKMNIDIPIQRPCTEIVPLGHL